MGSRKPGPVRIVVVADHDADTVTDCLDGLAAQGTERIDVVVVDLDSADGGADAAIHHPLPNRVVVTPPGSFDRVLALGAVDAPGEEIVVIGADRRPGDGWLDAALAGLADRPLVRPPDGGLHHLAMVRPVLLHLSFDGARDAVELERRVRSAGFTVGTIAGMRHCPARPLAPRPDLPTAAPTASDGDRYDGLVSIVVCTRDRPEKLARCLASLARLCDRHHEVVVIDNNDRPATPEPVVPGRGRVVHEPLRGLDHARNRGIAEAAGDVVAFVDDDCEADPRWLDAVRAAFGDPEVQAVTGRVRPAQLTEPCQRWFEAHFSFDRGSQPRRFTPWDRRPWYPMWPGGIGAGCNMAFRRDALVDVGGFDPLFDMGTSIGGGGDLDLFARLLDRGAIVSYRPDALVWHHHRATTSASRRQFFGYGVTVGALLTKAVLERPAHRYSALRFYLDRLQVAARLVRRHRAGGHVVPAGMVLLDIAGQLVGPAVYVAARARARPRLR